MRWMRGGGWMGIRSSQLGEELISWLIRLFIEVK